MGGSYDRTRGQNERSRPSRDTRRSTSVGPRGHSGTEYRAPESRAVRLGGRRSRQRLVVDVKRAIVRIAEEWDRVRIGGEQAPRLRAFPAQVEAG